MLFLLVVFVFLLLGGTALLAVRGAKTAGEAVVGVGVAEWTTGTVEVVVFFTTFRVA
jgi:hypothetical protein